MPRPHVGRRIHSNAGRLAGPLGSTSSARRGTTFAATWSGWFARREVRSPVIVRSEARVCVCTTPRALRRCRCQVTPEWATAISSSRTTAECARYWPPERPRRLPRERPVLPGGVRAERAVWQLRGDLSRGSGGDIPVQSGRGEVGSRRGGLESVRVRCRWREALVFRRACFGLCQPVHVNEIS